MSIEVVLGGLIGSILTVTITKILDLIQRSKEHEYALKKAFFEKKLLSAEAAAAKWNSSLSALKALAALYEHFASKGDAFNNDLFIYLNQAYSSQLQKIVQTSNELSNSIALYFDISDSKSFKSESTKRFFDSLSSLVSIDTTTSILVEIKDRFRGTDTEQIAEKEMVKLKQQSRDHFKELSSVFMDAEKDITELLKLLRSEMKKYDT